MCPHTTTYVSSSYYICVLMLVYMSTTIYVSSYYYMCPHTTLYVSSSYYICVLMLLYLSDTATLNTNMHFYNKQHLIVTIPAKSSPLREICNILLICVLILLYICVLILPYMCSFFFFFFFFSYRPCSCIPAVLKKIFGAVLCAILFVGTDATTILSVFPLFFLFPLNCGGLLRYPFRRY